MKKVFIIYKTDGWHSYDSRNVLGIATTINNVVKICKQHAYQEHYHITREQEFNLRSIKQTQGYLGEGEFQYEEITINSLL